MISLRCILRNMINSKNLPLTYDFCLLATPSQMKLRLWSGIYHILNSSTGRGKVTWVAERIPGLSLDFEAPISPREWLQIFTLTTWVWIHTHTHIYVLADIWAYLSQTDCQWELYVAETKQEKDCNATYPKSW